VWIDPRKSDISLRVWSDMFLRSSLSLAPTSLRSYRHDLDKYVLPALGDRPLSRLNAEEIEGWLGDELERELSPSSVYRHYRTLRHVLQAAVEKHRLLVNPCTKVRTPKVAARPMAILTWAQWVALVEALSANLRPMIYLALADADGGAVSTAWTCPRCAHGRTRPPRRSWMRTVQGQLRVGQPRQFTPLPHHGFTSTSTSRTWTRGRHH
jgi:hypothetical protein